MAQRHKITIGIAATLLTIAGTLATAIWVTASKAHCINDNTKAVKQIEPRLQRVEQSDSDQNTKIAVLEARQEAIHEGVKRIEKKIDAMP